MARAPGQSLNRPREVRTCALSLFGCQREGESSSSNPFMRSVLASLVLVACLLSAHRAHATDAEACEAASVKAQRLKLAHGLVEAKKELLVCSASECPTLVRRDCD